MNAIVVVLESKSNVVRKAEECIEDLEGLDRAMTLNRSWGHYINVTDNCEETLRKEEISRLRSKE